MISQEMFWPGDNTALGVTRTRYAMRSALRKTDEGCLRSRRDGVSTIDPLFLLASAGIESRKEGSEEVRKRNNGAAAKLLAAFQHYWAGNRVRGFPMLGRKEYIFPVQF